MQRRTVAVTAAALNSPTGHHGPVLQMPVKSGPPWEASKTPWDLQESRSQLTLESSLSLSRTLCSRSKHVWASCVAMPEFAPSSTWVTACFQTPL